MSPQQPPRRTQAQRRAEAEARVLDAATALVVEGGLGAVTLAEVGARAGYSRGIVTHHFGTRQVLLEALAERLQDAFRLPEQDGSDGRHHLVAIADAYLVHAGAQPLLAAAFLSMWAQSLVAEPHLRPTFAERDARFRRAVADAVRCGRRDGSIARVIDPETTAVVVVGLLRGVAMQALDPSDDLDLDGVRRAAGVLLERALS